jgi:hypothetical protein
LLPAPTEEATCTSIGDQTLDQSFIHTASTRKWKSTHLLHQQEDLVPSALHILVDFPQIHCGEVLQKATIVNTDSLRWEQLARNQLLARTHLHGVTVFDEAEILG